MKHNTNNRVLNVFQMCSKQNILNSVVDKDWKQNIKIHDFNTAIISEFGELLESTNWKWWKHQDQFDSWNAKIEAIDILHFGLSNIILQDNDISNEIFGATTSMLFSMIDDCGRLDRQAYQEHLYDILQVSSYSTLQRFLLSMNMTTEEISAIYTAKYVLNMFRQSDGYKDGTYTKVVDGVEDNVKLEVLVNDYLSDPTQTIENFELIVTNTFFK